MRLCGVQHARGGFPEKVYENALAHELSLQNIRFAQQHPVAVRYNGVVVGEYVADFLVEDRLVLELKAVKEIDPVHEAQCLNYLRATGLKTCLLINFGVSRLKPRRISL